AIRDEDQAFLPALEATVEAAIDEGDRAGRRRVADRVGHAGDLAGLFEQLGEPWSLVRGDDDAGVGTAPPRDRVGDARRAAQRQGRLPPAEEVAEIVLSL